MNAREENSFKVQCGTQLYNSCWNMMHYNMSLDDERVQKYMEEVFQMQFAINRQTVKNPSRARLLGAARCEMYHTRFNNTELELDLRFIVDYSWMIMDMNNVIYHNTFLPYEARLTARVKGVKKEEVITDTGYLSDKLTWRVETAFEDRGIRTIARTVKERMERVHRERVKRMLEGIGMDINLVQTV